MNGSEGCGRRPSGWIMPRYTPTSARETEVGGTWKWDADGIACPADSTMTLSDEIRAEQ
jgi:hypothetical protein